jgi:hypothetical protein
MPVAVPAAAVKIPMEKTEKQVRGEEPPVKKRSQPLNRQVHMVHFQNHCAVVKFA